tara:strand:+ start:379 stop:735 length:357 start_codon:yes stop_codon:yes gene_type:complete
MTEEKIEEYGQLSRRVFPTLYYDSTDTIYVNLIMKLEYEKLTKTEFFRALVDGFIHDNEYITRFVEEYKEQKQIDNKKNRRMIKEERSKAEEIDRRFGITSDDLENIFDLIEMEDGDV